MKTLGIDFGSKKIGLAISDDGGQMALPKDIIKNDNQLVENISDLIKGEDIKRVVVGLSVDQTGLDNPVMEQARSFIEKLKNQTGLEVFLQDESMTSLESRLLTGEKPVANKRRSKKTKAVDDKAATLILQRFLDKN